MLEGGFYFIIAGFRGSKQLLIEDITNNLNKNQYSLTGNVFLFRFIFERFPNGQVFDNSNSLQVKHNTNLSNQNPMSLLSSKSFPSQEFLNEKA